MASTLPDDPETLLTREAVAEALTDAGYPTSPKTLATKASRGGGPHFENGPTVRSMPGDRRWHGRNPALAQW